MAGYSKIVDPALQDLVRFIARPSRSVVERTSGRTTVRDPRRKAFGEVYRSPRTIVDESAGKIGPEDPLLHELFGVNRQDIDDIAKERYASGPQSDDVEIYVPKYGGSEWAFNVDTPANTDRVQDIINLAATDPRYAGNFGWYENQPLLDAYIREWGPEEGLRRWDRFHQIGAAFSPGSDVSSEIRRATEADRMAYGGEGAKFLDMLGEDAWKKAGRPEGMKVPDTYGHIYHSSAHQKARPVLEGIGGVPFDPLGSPKTNLYYMARTHRNMDYPIADAHYGRIIGMPDVRYTIPKTPEVIKGKKTGRMIDNPGASLTAREYYPVQQWYRDKVVGPIGIPGVPGQALQWNAGATSTGVDTAVGAPFLELVSMAIGRRAKQLGKSAKTVRDEWIKGKESLYSAGGAVPLGLEGFGSEEQLRTAYQGTLDNAQESAIEAEAYMDAPTRPQSVNPVAGDLASVAEGVESPADMFSPSSLAQYLRDLERGRTSGLGTTVGAALDLTDPITMGLTVGHAMR